MALSTNHDVQLFVRYNSNNEDQNPENCSSPSAVPNPLSPKNIPICVNESNTNNLNALLEVGSFFSMSDLTVGRQVDSDLRNIVDEDDFALMTSRIDGFPDSFKNQCIININPNSEELSIIDTCRICYGDDSSEEFISPCKCKVFEKVIEKSKELKILKKTELSTGVK
ncbi:hypothetical protein Avbf_09904 [Armadillidium vulgare]|nr:hypothetical protein Avbf_09904 [Armadillidium vulgare]